MLEKGDRIEVFSDLPQSAKYDIIIHQSGQLACGYKQVTVRPWDNRHVSCHFTKSFSTDDYPSEVTKLDMCTLYDGKLRRSPHSIQI